MKNEKIYNGTICKISDIHDDKIIVNNLIFDVDVFSKKFEPAFCQTVYKYQGSTIKQNFTIYELDMMTKREFYTSLSRGIKQDMISYNYNQKKFINSDVSKSVELKVKVSNDIDDKYKNGKIYKITFDDNIYIGSTHRTLDERFDEHKKASRGSLFVETLKKNKDRAIITLIKKFPCKSQKELMNEEEIYIHQALEDKSYICLNTMMTKKKSKIRDTEIEIDRLDKVEDDKYHIVEYANKNIYRFQYKDSNGRKYDISSKWSDKCTKEQALIKIEKKKAEIMKI
jgi:hypothetical protein